MRKCLSLLADVKKASEEVGIEMAVVAKWQAQLFMQLSQNNNFISIFVPLTTTTTTISEWLGIFPIPHTLTESHATLSNQMQKLWLCAKWNWRKCRLCASTKENINTERGKITSSQTIIKSMFWSSFIDYSHANVKSLTCFPRKQSTKLIEFKAVMWRWNKQQDQVFERFSELRWIWILFRSIHDENANWNGKRTSNSSISSSRAKLPAMNQADKIFYLYFERKKIIAAYDEQTRSVHGKVDENSCLSTLQSL